MENLKQVAMADGALAGLRNQLLRKIMMDSHAKPQNVQQKLQLQRMEQEMRIQKLQRELEERRLHQAKLEQMLAAQSQPATQNLTPDPVNSFGGQSGLGEPTLKALPMDAMMQALRQRLHGANNQPSGSTLMDLGANTNLDPMAIGFQKPGPSVSQPFDINSLMPANKSPMSANPGTNKHTINITVKRKTKVDVPGLPVSMPNLNQINQAPLQTNPAASAANAGGISPELLQMLDALRAGNAAAADQALTSGSSVQNEAATPKTQLTTAALAGAPAVQQVENPLSAMVNAAAAVHKQQSGVATGNILATAVSAKKASSTMADIVDTQMDAMADMAEAGMGFGMMNMMSGMNMMGGVNMLGGMGGGLGGMGGMGGLGGLGGMGGLGMGGMGMGNAMMSSTMMGMMSPFGLM